MNSNGTTKFCPRCQTEKPLDDFPKDKRSFDGRYGYCKRCKADYMADYNAARTPEHTLRYNLARRCREHGITIEEYEALLDAQGHRCAICGTSDTQQFGRFCFDHDHATGKLRGLLCPACNAGLGHFRDLPSSLRNAADYLDRHA